MGVTANYDLPYPDNDDAADVPYDVQQLADATDAQLLAMGADSGWIDVTIASGFTGMAGTEKPQVRKIGKVVYLRGGWLTGSGNGVTAANTSYTVGTVPAGYRPASHAVGAAGSSVGAAVCDLRVLTTGSVEIRTSGTLGAYVKGDGRTWMID